MSEIREIYTKLASEYDEAADKLFRSWLIKDAEYRRRVVEKLNLKEGNTVLEIGCGTGWNFEYLRKKIGEKGYIVGFDLTLPMLKKDGSSKKESQGKSAHNHSLSFLRMHATQYPSKTMLCLNLRFTKESSLACMRLSLRINFQASAFFSWLVG